jgi:hypothetical protein
MHGIDVKVVGNAVFEELQTKASTSLISRDMITVTVTGNGALECLIDMNSLGIPPRTIRSKANSQLDSDSLVTSNTFSR